MNEWIEIKDGIRHKLDHWVEPEDSEPLECVSNVSRLEVTDMERRARGLSELATGLFAIVLMVVMVCLGAILEEMFGFWYGWTFCVLSTIGINYAVWKKGY